MADGERGYWPLWVGELQDTATGGSSESVSAAGYMPKISMAEAWVVAMGERGCWPFDANELIIFMVDVAAVGHSTNESTGSARSHRFLLNKRECETVPYLAHQLSVFYKLD